MALIPGADQKPQTPKELMPKGMFIARCYSIVDMGTHDEVDTKSGKTNSRRKIYIGWEFDCLMKEPGDNQGKPFVNGKTYTYSLFEQAQLYKDLTSWEPNGFDPKDIKTFDLATLFDQYATITIAHKPNASDPKIIYANISSIVPYNEKVGVKFEPVNPNLYFETTETDIGKLVKDWQKLYKWQQKKIIESAEWDTLRMFLEGKEVQAPY